MELNVNSWLQVVCISTLASPLLDFSPELAACFSSYVCIFISGFLVQWLELSRVHSSHSPRWVRCITWLRFGPSSYVSDPMHTIGTFFPDIAMLCNLWCDSFQSDRLAPFSIFLWYDTPSTDTDYYCFNNVSYALASRCLVFCWLPPFASVLTGWLASPTMPFISSSSSSFSFSTASRWRYSYVFYANIRHYTPNHPS